MRPWHVKIRRFLWFTILTLPRHCKLMWAYAGLIRISSDSTNELQFDENIIYFWSREAIVSIFLIQRTIKSVEYYNICNTNLLDASISACAAAGLTFSDVLSIIGMGRLNEDWHRNLHHWHIKSCYQSFSQFIIFISSKPCVYKIVIKHVFRFF